jgi:hypothetical protein
VLNSTAGPGLLDTYEAERRPIAEQVVAESLRLLANRGSGTTEGASDQQRAVELVLGFRYRSTAVLTEDDPADNAVDNPVDSENRTSRPVAPGSAHRTCGCAATAPDCPL